MECGPKRTHNSFTICLNKNGNRKRTSRNGKLRNIPLTPFDLGFQLNRQLLGGGGAWGMRVPHHNFVLIAAMIMKFGKGVKLGVFYTINGKKLSEVTTITSL